MLCRLGKNQGHCHGLGLGRHFPFAKHHITLHHHTVITLSLRARLIPSSHQAYTTLTPKQHNTMSEDQEDRAIELSELPPSEIQSHVEQIVRHILKSPPNARRKECEQIAWLVNYSVLDPMVLLRVLIVTRDNSLLKISGTYGFAPDLINKYKLPVCDPSATKRPRYEGTAIPIDFKRILKRPASEVDTGTTSSNSTNEDHNDTNGTKSANASKPPHPSKKLKPDPEYSAQLRKLLLSSMSPIESVHKVTKVFKSGTESTVAETLLNITMEHKMYNRIYGQTAVMLKRNHPQQHWNTAFDQLLSQFVFSDTFNSLKLEELVVSAGFFAHLLSTQTMNYAALSTLTLDLRPEHASMRIFVDALFRELKLDLGEIEVKQILKRDDLVNIANNPLSPEFWALMGISI